MLDTETKRRIDTFRLAHRRKDPSNPPNPSEKTDPIPKCTQCGAQLALRTAKSGKDAGSQFWGCTKYPNCKTTATV
jgi:ssDNA-binding Zn-finger/Zn-ribbon topoisomerase 1